MCRRVRDDLLSKGSYRPFRSPLIQSNIYTLFPLEYPLPCFVPIIGPLFDRSTSTWPHTNSLSFLFRSLSLSLSLSLYSPGCLCFSSVVFDYNQKHFFVDMFLAHFRSLFISRLARSLGRQTDRSFGVNANFVLMFSCFSTVAVHFRHLPAAEKSINNSNFFFFCFQWSVSCSIVFAGESVAQQQRTARPDTARRLVINENLCSPNLRSHFLHFPAGLVSTFPPPARPWTRCGQQKEISAVFD